MVRTRRVHGLAGFAVLVVVADNLGLPLTGGYLAIDVLMVAVGFELARSALAADGGHGWLKRFWLHHLTRIAAPTLVAVALVVAYWGFDDRLDEPKLRAVLGAVTLTPNLFRIFAGARFDVLDHLWAIGIVVQFAVVAPLLVTCHRRMGRERRAVALLGLAAAVATWRLGLLVAGAASPEAIAVNTLTRMDGLVVGAAIGVLPVASMRRRVSPKVASVAFVALLLLLLVAPSEDDYPITALGVMVALAVFLAAVVLASEVIGGHRSALAVTLDSHLLHWLGARAVGLYIWHQLFGFALSVDDPAGSELQTWPGFAVFTMRVVFTMAAAATSYLYLELPIGMAMRRVVARSEAQANREPAGRPPSVLEPM